jgi:tRNA-modifying protein YgfZ
MRPLSASPDELQALEGGRAAVDLSDHRKVRVQGSEARRWLHDLVTADVATLEPGRATRSLLLDPSGHIRADIQVACSDDGFWLFQAPDQTDHVAGALAQYVLSSDVRITDASATHRLASIGAGADGFEPSTLGTGRDVLTDVHGWADLVRGWVMAGPDAVEVHRIRKGRARMGSDFDRTAIPAQAGLEHLIDTGKGCFLGQESVARVRNLGHPPTVLLHLSSEPAVAASTVVVDDSGEEVGVVTSAAAAPVSGTLMLASIRWAARDRSLHDPHGSPLHRVGSLG